MKPADPSWETKGEGKEGIGSIALFTVPDYATSVPSALLDLQDLALVAMRRAYPRWDWASLPRQDGARGRWGHAEVGWQSLRRWFSNPATIAAYNAGGDDETDAATVGLCCLYALREMDAGIRKAHGRDLDLTPAERAESQAQMLACFRRDFGPDVDLDFRPDERVKPNVRQELEGRRAQSPGEIQNLIDATLAVPAPTPEAVAARVARVLAVAPHDAPEEPSATPPQDAPEVVAVAPQDAPEEVSETRAPESLALAHLMSALREGKPIPSKAECARAAGVTPQAAAKWNSFNAAWGRAKATEKSGPRHGLRDQRTRDVDAADGEVDDGG